MSQISQKNYTEEEINKIKYGFKQRFIDSNFYKLNKLKKKNFFLKNISLERIKEFNNIDKLMPALFFLISSDVYSLDYIFCEFDIEKLKIFSTFDEKFLSFLIYRGLFESVLNLDIEKLKILKLFGQDIDAQYISFNKSVGFFKNTEYFDDFFSFSCEKLEVFFEMRSFVMFLLSDNEDYIIKDDNKEYLQIFTTDDIKKAFFDLSFDDFKNHITSLNNFFNDFSDFQNRINIRKLFFNIINHKPSQEISFISVEKKEELQRIQE